MSCLYKEREYKNILSFLFLKMFNVNLILIYCSIFLLFSIITSTENILLSFIKRFLFFIIKNYLKCYGIPK